MYTPFPTGVCLGSLNLVSNTVLGSRIKARSGVQEVAKAHEDVTRIIVVTLLFFGRTYCRYHLNKNAHNQAEKRARLRALVAAAPAPTAAPAVPLAPPPAPAVPLAPAPLAEQW